MTELEYGEPFEDKLKGYDLLLREYQKLEKELKEANDKLANQKYLTDKDVEKAIDLIWNLCQKKNVSEIVRDKIIVSVKHLCTLAVVTWLQLAEQKQFTDTNANVALKFKEELENQPKLNRQEVEKIFKTEWLSGDSFGGTLEKLLKMMISFLPVKNKPHENEIIEQLITAICNLALPEIEEGKIVEVDLTESFYNPDRGTIYGKKVIGGK